MQMSKNDDHSWYANYMLKDSQVRYFMRDRVFGFGGGGDGAAGVAPFVVAGIEFSKRIVSVTKPMYLIHDSSLTETQSVDGERWCVDEAFAFGDYADCSKEV